MNQINKIRSEIQEYFKPDNEIAGSDEIIISPGGNYSIKVKSFVQIKPNCNWDVTKVEVFKTLPNTLLMSFFVNEGTFFHSWVTKDSIEYLLCAEDLCGGQTVINLESNEISSYTADNDGFIWTKHLLSPDESLLAVFGCGWGSAFFIIVYHFDNPMNLPLKIASEPNWTGYDIVEWIDNKNLKVKNSEREESILAIM